MSPEHIAIDLKTAVEESSGFKRFQQVKLRHPDAIYLEVDPTKDFVFAYDQDAEVLNSLLGAIIFESNYGPKIAGFKIAKLEAFISILVRSGYNVVTHTRVLESEDDEAGIAD